jgi:hypothetical protein
MTTYYNNQPTAGTTQTDASPMLAHHVIVPSATDGQGLVLRPSNTGDQLSVTNKSSVAIYVYPPSGATINSGLANIPWALPAGYLRGAGKKLGLVLDAQLMCRYLVPLVPDAAPAQ